MYSLAKVDNKLLLRGKNETGAFKIVISTNEEKLIDDLTSTLDSISSKANCKPNIFTFYSNYYTSNVVMRSMKYNKLKQVTPMKKYAIVDLKASLGNYNNLFDCLNYLGLTNLKEKFFYISELESDVRTPTKSLFNEFLEYSSEKTHSLGVLAKNYIENTYGNDFRQNVVLDIETHADLSKKEMFIEAHPKYKDESEEEIIKLMARNPLYNILYSYSVCLLN